MPSLTAVKSTIATASALALATALAPAPASAQMVQEGDPRPGLWDIVTPDAIATALFNIGITVARSHMEISYDYLTSDVTRGSFALAGLTLRPNFYYDQAGQCEITVERATFSQAGGALGLTFPIGVSAGAVNLIGVEATTACLDPELADVARAVGLRRLSLDQAKLDISYDVASGEISGAIVLALDGVAQLDIRAAGTYLTVPNEFFANDPAVRMTEAVVTLKDRGGWDLIATMLPGDFRDPEVIREVGTEALVNMLYHGGAPTLGATDRLFIDQLMDRVADYVAEPGEITLEANLPDSGVIVSERTVGSPLELIQVLALTARTAPSSRGEILSLADIEARKVGSPSGQLDLADALLSGTGVPRSSAGAYDIANALVAEPEVGARAALIVARATMETDPAMAYENGLIAAAGGEDGAIAILDATEARLTTPQVLSLQPGFAAFAEDAPDTGLQAVLDAGGDDPRALRQAALDRLYGVDVARSYAQAYYFAILAEAAGDIAAASLTEEIDRRFALRGGDAAESWTQAKRAAEQAAIDDWFGLDLPALYRRN